MLRPVLWPPVLSDTGIFIDALFIGDLRHAEARPLVEQARHGTPLAVESHRKMGSIRRKRNYEEVEILR
jgi:predicted nucleic acid-binding protein